MRDKKYDNCEMADAYFRISSFCLDRETSERIRDTILNSDFSLKEFYEKEGAFDGLNIERIDSYGKYILELIVEEGEEVATDMIKAEERVKSKSIESKNILHGW